MAEGIPYFPLDVYVDDKIRLIEAEFGLKGFAVIVKLYQKIYGGFGYYCEWTNDVGLLFSQDVGEGYSSVSEIVSAAIRRGIFDNDLYEKYNILTSQGVQKRYFSAVSRRKQINVKSEYLLINVEQFSKNVNISSENVSRNTKNAYNFEQSKEKKTKVNKSIVNESKVKTDDGAPPSAAVLHAYEKYIGIVTPLVADDIDDFLSKGVEPELIIRIIEYACERNARNRQYIQQAIMNNLNDGILTLDAYNRKEADRRVNYKPPQKKSKFNNYTSESKTDYAELEEQILDSMLDGDYEREEQTDE